MKEKLEKINEAILTLKAVRREIKLSNQYADDVKISIVHEDSTITIKIKEGWVQTV